MQLFAHLLSSYLQGMGDFFSALFWGVAVTPVGKRVFLLVVATIPNAMLSMTTTAGMVQKAAVGGKKKPGCSPEQKQLLAEAQPISFHYPGAGNAYG